MHRTAREQDKFLRCLQNVARLLAWVLSATPSDHHYTLSLGESLLGFARQISLTSKLTRGLRIPEFLQAAAKAVAPDPTDTVSSHLTVAKMLSLTVFSTLDFATYVNSSLAHARGFLTNIVLLAA